MNTAKMTTLSPEIVQVLRGERDYNGRFKDLLSLAGFYYQDGKAGKPYALGPVPGFAPQFLEMMDRFLRTCWEQGRKDAAGGRTA